MYVLFKALAVCMCAVSVAATKSFDEEIKSWQFQYEKHMATLPPVKILNRADPVRYADCHHLKTEGYNISGIHQLHVNRTFSFNAHCDFKGINALTTIQQRLTPSFNFNTYYAYYVNGFGHPASDYWAGLAAMNHLSTQGNTKLKITMQDWSGYTGYAKYNIFYVYDASQSYMLHVANFDVTSTVGDDLSVNSGMPFAAPDRPDKYNCVNRHRTGWWYNYCTRTLPNGYYYIGGPYTPPSGYPDGIFWDQFRGVNYSLKYFLMQVSR